MSRYSLLSFHFLDAISLPLFFPPLFASSPTFKYSFSLL